MRSESGHISLYVTALILVGLLGGCSSAGGRAAYFPKSLETTLVTELVKVIKPSSGKLVGIDGNKVRASQVMYVTPGNHKFTFSIRYRSSTYCSGPLSGQRAAHDFVQDGAGVSRTAVMLGEYDMDVSARAGQTVKFAYKPSPDCKSNMKDYFQVVVFP